jgi:hypothetical protein
MTERNLGPLFTAPLPNAQLDADAVIRASRGRRLRRFIALGTASLLVVAGAIGGASLVLPNLSPSTTSAASSGSNHPGALPATGATIHTVGPRLGGVCEAISPIPGDKVLCGCGTATLPPITNDIAAQLSFPAEREGHSSDGVVTLTNTGQAAISGTASTPVPFIVDRGLIVSPIGNNDSAAHAVSLAPGASESIAVAFPGVDCAAGNAPTGEYRVGAFIELALANGQHVGIVAANANVAVSQ